MRAAIYARLSMDREGTSAAVDRQEADCRELCEARGWEVVQVFSDNDVSASSGRRRPADSTRCPVYGGTMASSPFLHGSEPPLPFTSATRNGASHVK